MRCNMTTASPASATVSSFLPPQMRVRGFRTRLLVAMMLVVTAVTALALYLAERNLAANVRRELEREFQSQLAALHHAQAIRHAALVERCRALVRKPRIHAALEDDALDLLYPSAEDELRDVMAPAAEPPAADGHEPALRAAFYRFLDRTGRVIVPPAGAPVGPLSAATEARLALPRLDGAQQLGYLLGGSGATIAEVIATPIVSTETGEAIAALVLGFKPFNLAADHEMRSGIWTEGALHLPGLDPAAARELAREVAAAIAAKGKGSRPVQIGGEPHMMFFNRLNADALYPPGYEVSLFPLEQFSDRAAQLRFQIIGAGALLLVGAFVASRVIAARLSAPVERLAVDSERSARFSADASHQLKTPVTVLRAGLEELLTRENLTPAECDAIAALIHQTYRLSSLIEDLLLLSRMDSGRLKLAIGPVDLTHLIAGALDDLGAIPDSMSLQIETQLPPVLHVLGEKRYTAMILQNLLENARKYNRPGGRIRVAARIEGEAVLLGIANTGIPIAPAVRAHIFERFHRGAIGENVAGYGLGLNLARELVRLHFGDLRLVGSDEQWTEFEVTFRLARPATPPG